MTGNVSLFYDSLTCDKNTFQKIINRRNLTNEQIDVKINAKHIDKDIEREFLGEDCSEAMIWIQEYMEEQTKLPSYTNITKQLEEYDDYHKTNAIFFKLIDQEINDEFQEDEFQEEFQFQEEF